MATATAQTTADGFVELLQRLADVLATHPNGGEFCLMFTPVGVEIGQDEVLVQYVDPATRTIVLRARKISDLEWDDVVFGTQVVNPADSGFARYAIGEWAASVCTFVEGSGGFGRHIYVTPDDSK